jgi:hypothetical protein
MHPPASQEDKGKHKMKSGYTSSLSVTYGSASEAEAERGALRRFSLTDMGHWANTNSEPTRPLKGSARAKEHQQARRMSKHKKPVVIIEQNVCAQQNGRIH